MSAEGTNPHELEILRKKEEDEESCEEELNTVEEPKKQWTLLLEPALIGAMMAINMGSTSLQNFYLKTACTVDLGKPQEICFRGVGEEFQMAEAASQMVVTKINVSRSFVGSIISTCVLLFAGPWSDCSGRRKPLLILPLVGMCVMTTSILFLMTFPGASAAQVLYAVQIPISIGGNFPMLLAASFSYIGDVCHKEGMDVTRTFGTHRAAIQIANVLGAISGPLLYRNFGFYGVFPIVLSLQLFSLIYVIVYVKDVKVNADNKVSVCNWRLPFNAIQCLTRSRDGFRRAILLLMLLSAFGDRTVLSAEVFLSFMFYRVKFKWDDVMFGAFLAYRNIVGFIGTLFILSVLKRRLKLSDEVVGMLSYLSFILASSGIIAATTTVIVCLVPLVGIIMQGSQIVQRPIMNKQILPTEQGKIYSVLGALEAATQIFTTPLYSLLYSKTVSTMPDAWLIPGMAFASLQLLLYLIAKKLGRRTLYEDRRRPSQIPKVVEKENFTKKTVDVKYDTQGDKSSNKTNT